MAQERNIIETVLAVNETGPYAGSFDTLIAALLVAKGTVVKTLSGKKDYTVFGATGCCLCLLRSHARQYRFAGSKKR